MHGRREKAVNQIRAMSGPTFISLWAGDFDIAKRLPAHLNLLYKSIGPSHWVRDPEVCDERELVPIDELLETFSLPEEFAAEAKETAWQKSLRLASVVVAVYTHEAPGVEVLQPPGCGLQYLGTCTAFE